MRGQPGHSGAAVAYLTAADTSSDQIVLFVIPAIRIDRVVEQIFEPVVVVAAKLVERLLAGAEHGAAAAFAVA